VIHFNSNDLKLNKFAISDLKGRIFRSASGRSQKNIFGFSTQNIFTSVIHLVPGVFQKVCQASLTDDVLSDGAELLTEAAQKIIRQ